MARLTKDIDREEGTIAVWLTAKNETEFDAIVALIGNKFSQVEPSGCPVDEDGQYTDVILFIDKEKGTWNWAEMMIEKAYQHAKAVVKEFNAGKKTSVAPVEVAQDTQADATKALMKKVPHEIFVRMDEQGDEFTPQNVASECKYLISVILDGGSSYNDEPAEAKQIVKECNAFLKAYTKFQAAQAVKQEVTAEQYAVEQPASSDNMDNSNETTVQPKVEWSRLKAGQQYDKNGKPTASKYHFIATAKTGKGKVKYWAKYQQDGTYQVEKNTWNGLWGSDGAHETIIIQTGFKTAALAKEFIVQTFATEF